MQETITIQAPMITQQFDADLLKFDMWLTREVLRQTYWNKAKEKYKPNSKKLEKLDEILGIYEQIYKWQKAQKTFENQETYEMYERPDVPVDAIYRLKGAVGKNVRGAFIAAGFLQKDDKWKDYGVQKI